MLKSASSMKRLFCAQRTFKIPMRTMVMAKPLHLLEPPAVPEKKLFGPGPSNLSSAVTNALSQPMLGHLHTEFIKIMDDVRDGLKYVFQTNNDLTFCVSGTGHAGMECALMNLLEVGERVLVIRNGIWGERAAALGKHVSTKHFPGKRLNFDVHVLNVPDGYAADLETIATSIITVKPKVVFVCHGESSTGVMHPLDGLGKVCHEHNALLLVDTVASLCGSPFNCDELEVDCVYTATQKALNAPPGLAPISFSNLALEKIKNRKTPVVSFYFDALQLGNYWGCFNEPRRYHHTGMVSLVYALREALAIIVREGVENSIKRHEENARILYSQLNAAGFELFVKDEKLRLPCLTTVKVPDGVEWKKVADNLMSQGIEIAGGLGATAGKIWRIGTFGLNSDKKRFSFVVELLQRATSVSVDEKKKAANF